MGDDMEKGSTRFQRWRENLSHTYRLVVMNNETFEEVGAYQLTLRNVYIAVSSILVMVAVGVFLLIAFTPLRRYIPGYNHSTADQEASIVEAYRQIEDLEKALNAQTLLTENIRKVMVNQVETEEDVPKISQAPADTVAEAPKRANIDEQMRQELEIEELGKAAESPTAMTSLNREIIPLEQMYFVSPLNGEISAAYAPDKRHYGVDVVAAKNTAIKAAADGYVFLSDWTLEAGNTIGIQHNSNTITFYKHNSVLLKKPGSYVKAGEAVAIIGNTGTMTSGPHLHFELWYRGRTVDPTEYLSF